MQDFHHPHVMSLIGVCLDAGPGVSIVMPYMGNGSLLDYLKKERGSLQLDEDSEIDQVGLHDLLTTIWYCWKQLDQFKCSYDFIYMYRSLLIIGPPRL